MSSLPGVVSPPEPIPPRQIVDNAAVRKLCGGVSRPTLILWRNNHGFPKPIPARTSVDLWDAREVRAWLKSRRT